MPLINSNTKQRFREFITRMLVRFKRVKRSPAQLEEVEQLLNESLPERFSFSLTNVSAELSILSASINVDRSKVDPLKENLQAELQCSFKVILDQAIIYKSKLKVNLEADPNYCKTTISIGVINTKMIKLKLVDDKDAFINDAATFANGILPAPLKTLFNLTLATTNKMLGGNAMTEMTKYLSLYKSGSTQMVIDYHRKEIEQKIIQLVDNNAISYQLDTSVFEEELFATYGEKVAIEDGQLFFIFKS